MAVTAGLSFLPFIGRLAAERVGADRAAALLREQGLRFTQSVFREYYRAQQLRVQYGPLLQGLPDRIPIPLSLFTPTAGRFIQPFRYVFEVTGRDNRTGEVIRTFRSLATDSILSREQALREIANAHGVRSRETYTGIDVDDVSLAEVQLPFGEEVEVL